jgi:hypothetical protein
VPVLQNPQILAFRAFWPGFAGFCALAQCTEHGIGAGSFTKFIQGRFSLTFDTGAFAINRYWSRTMSETQQPNTLDQALQTLDELSQLGSVEAASTEKLESLRTVVDKVLGVRGAFDAWRAATEKNK